MAYYSIPQVFIDSIGNQPEDYRGYIELGDYFFDINIDQAYLCYENALFWCKDRGNTQIQNKLSSAAEAGAKVQKYAIVILSYNNRMLTQQCIESIRDTSLESSREIIVVDNASNDDSVEYLREQKDIVMIENTENMGFPKGCNQGIEAAEKDSDILLLNNDVVVMPNALFWLRMGLYSNENIGAAGSVANKAYMQWSGEREGTMDYFREHARKTNVPMEKPIEYRTWLVGFCLIVKRKALDKIGVLDEGFSPGYGEDEDLCFRLLLSDFYNVLVLNSYVVHMEHESFNKRKDYADLIHQGWLRKKEKYGCDLDPYFFDNTFFTSLVREYIQGNSLLDLNCGIGASLFKWKSLFPEYEFEGIDRDIPTGVFRRSNTLIPMRNYSELKYAPVKDKYDCIAFNANTIKKQELTEYLTFCSEHLNMGGRLLLVLEYGCNYKYWFYQMVYGKSAVDGTMGPTIQEAEHIFDEMKFKVIRHLLNYNFPEHNESNSMLYKIVDSLPEEIKDKMFIAQSGIVLEKQ